MSLIDARLKLSQCIVRCRRGYTGAYADLQTAYEDYERELFVETGRIVGDD